jgi:hypothetical protein
MIGAGIVSHFRSELIWRGAASHRSPGWRHDDQLMIYEFGEPQV